MNRALLFVAVLPGLWGCLSVTHAGGDAGVRERGDGGTLTWHRDVAPVAQERCGSCHVEGGIAPFPVQRYEQVKAWHASMAAAVEAKRMPPWMPAEGCQDLQGSRALEDWEEDTFIVWSRQGALEGDPADAPAAPGPAAELPWVDVTLSPPEPYVPRASVADDYHCFVLDPKLTEAKDLVGFDILPGERKTVHHVILYYVDPADAAAQDPDGKGWTCYGGPGSENPQMLGGWVPGTAVTQYPTGTGIPMAAGKVIVMQVHYNLQPGPLPDKTTVKLQLAKSRVPYPATIVPQAQPFFAIPPGATNHRAQVTNDIIPLVRRLWGVLPHMHSKGRSIQLGLRDAATNQTACLLDIPAWDFHWQQFYFYEQPVALPSSGTVTLTCTWDNPTDRLVTWGEGTDDEMCLNYYYVTQ